MYVAFVTMSQGNTGTPWKETVVKLEGVRRVSQNLDLGPDYMSRAGPVNRAASVWACPVVM